MANVLIARAMMTMDPVDYPAVLAELARAEKSTPADADIFYIRGKVLVRLESIPRKRSTLCGARSCSAPRTPARITSLA